MGDLDMDARQVVALVEEGKLIAFNISATSIRRMDLRILTKSVEHYRETGGKKPHILEWPEVFHLILPHKNLFVRGNEVSRGLNCNPSHVANLISTSFLAVSRKSKPGPDGSPFIIRASYENFLIGRLQ
jgi:hypothetical protein